MTDGQAVPLPADCDEYLTRPCLCGPACCPHCPHVTAIAGMLASRYSGQPTQRDLDVAELAAAAERARWAAKLREMAAAVLPEVSLTRASLDAFAKAYPNSPGQAQGRLLLQLADLLEGRTDGQ